MLAGIQANWDEIDIIWAFFEVLIPIIFPIAIDMTGGLYSLYVIQGCYR